MMLVYRSVIEAFQRGDRETARKHQLLAISIIEVMIAMADFPQGKR